jgi:cell division protein FtsI/penicillin-binding protein 2
MRGDGGRVRIVLLAAGVAVLLVVVAGVVVWQRGQAERRADEAAARAAGEVAAALQAGDLAAAPVQDAAAASALHTAVVEGLGVAPEVAAGETVREDSTATTPLTWTWPFGPDGWTYETELVTTEADDGTWSAAWSPALVHPDLSVDGVLAATRTTAPRAGIVRPDGSVVVGEQPVVRVGVQPSRVQDLASLTATLADLLDVDAAALAERVEGAQPEAFVDVITLRRGDYDAIKEELQPLPGTVFAESTLPLAPTREFARALLGTVGPATAEIVEASDGRVAAGDQTGLSGLQRQYDERLAGTAGVTVELVSEGAARPARTELFSVPPVAGEPLVVTLDPRVQQAADTALAQVVSSGSLGADGGEGNAAVVAVSVSTGEVLAVANTPASGTNRAMTGQYPPGSTFKAVSTQALLAAGVRPTDTVACPPTATVDGRSFKNFEGGALGDSATFADDFAESCNTAFVGLSERLGDDALAAAAAPMGLGAGWTVGTDAFTGGVPANESAVDKAAASIGQGRNLASPLAMAVAAGTIARGSFVDPTLVDPAADTAVEVPAPVADLAVVRDLMRRVATDGTASALADVPGEPVHAKTGTAEYGTEVPPRTHGWTIGFQGDVAFAVLVEDGVSGARSGVPVAEAFLRGLG